MKKTKFILLIIISSLFTQNISSHVWSGYSVSTSDNLDALNLNPAGLGVDRGNQYAFTIKQIPHDNDEYYIGFTTRSKSGFASEIYHDEDSFKYAFGYGFSIFNDLYGGLKYQKDEDYSIGLLYRPLNGVSVGTTIYSNADNNDYDFLRYGIAIRPFTFKKIKHSKSSFLNHYILKNIPENFTLGYDKTQSGINSQIQEQYFLNFKITPGIDFSYFTTGDTYGINLSFNIGNSGVQINNYPSNSFLGANTSSNSISFFNYSQRIDSDLDFSKKDHKKYVKMKLDGYFIEEKPTTSPFDFMFSISIPPFSSQNIIGTQLKQWIDHLDEISEDKTIDGLIIYLGNVRAGLAKREEMFNALMRLKESGKKIIVYSDQMISGANYHLISMADEIYTHHMNGVDLKGFNLEVTYLRQLLDTLSIVPEVVRVSPYKTGPETMLNKSMSNEFKENYGELLDDIYDKYINDISLAKNWEIDRTIMTVDLGPYWNTNEAIDKGLLTGTFFPDEFDSYIENINNENISFISWDDYELSDDYSNNWKSSDKPKIAIIYAVGGIIRGESNPGPTGSSFMGDKTIIKAIKKAREDDDIDAIVLRVDSGGGSALASDMMWREVFKTTDENQKNKKPLIVSMSDAAASGGYYISCQADEIIADNFTLTGSIGVYYMRYNFSQLLERIGVYSDNIKRGENADFGSMKHLLTEEERQIALSSIMTTYDTFKQRVIDGRKTLNDKNELDDIALGRVWGGKKAKEHGLVDKIGGIHDAIEMAKEYSNIEGDYDVIELPEVKSFSIFDLFKNENDNSSIIEISIDDLFPDEISQQLKTLNLIPVVINDEIQLIMPYQIDIN